MPDDTAEGVKDRLARRFEGEAQGDAGDERSSDGGASQHESGDETDSATETATSGAPDEASKTDDEPTSSKKAKNVKKEWKALSVYLPDDLENDLSRAYKKLDWQLEESEGRAIKKTRHYYPLVVDLGLERLEEMESDEIVDRIDRIGE